RRGKGGLFRGRRWGYRRGSVRNRRLADAVDRQSCPRLGRDRVRLPHRRGALGRKPQRVLRRGRNRARRTERSCARLSRPRLQAGVSTGNPLPEGTAPGAPASFGAAFNNVVGLMCMAPSTRSWHVFSLRELAYDFAWPRPRFRCFISTAIRLTIRPSTSFISRRLPRAPPFTTGRSAPTVTAIFFRFC